MGILSDAAIKLVDPLLDIDENRTLAIYPSYFAKEVPNTTNSWSLSTLKEKRRAKIPYPQLPQLATEKISKAEWESIEHDKQAVVIRPGDVLVFPASIYTVRLSIPLMV